MLVRLRNYINRSFGRRLLFFFVPYIILLLVSATLLSFNSFFNALKQEKENSTKTLVSQISDNFDFYFSDIKTLMAFISLNKDIQEALTQHGELSVQARYFLNSRISDATGNVNVFKSYINDILTIGQNGFVSNLPNYNSLSHTVDLVDQAWLKSYRPSKHSNFYFSPPHLADYYTPGSPVRWVVSSILPIKSEGRTVGYLQGDIDYETLRTLLDRIYHQNDIEITMVTADGMIAFDRDSSRLNSQLDPRIFARLQGTEGSFVDSQPNGNAMIVYQRSDVTDWYLIASVPYSTLLNTSYSVSKNILFFILPISLAVALIIFLLISRQLRQPWSRLIHRMETVNVANYTPATLDYGVGEIAELGHQFETMLAQNNELVERVYVAEIKKKNAELHTLREQITPHFLYNSLQVIKAEAVFSQNREISQMVSAIANLLRYSMDNRTASVTVADEVDYIQAYLDIYKRRFLGKFDYRIDIPGAMMGYTMPKMLLQPLVENCIKHGFEQMKSGGSILIRGHRELDACVFEVQDNGKGICCAELGHLVLELASAAQDAHDGIGLFNVHQRVVLERGPDYGITEIDSVEGQYTRVVLRV